MFKRKELTSAIGANTASKRFPVTDDYTRIVLPELVHDRFTIKTESMVTSPLDRIKRVGAPLSFQNLDQSHNLFGAGFFREYFLQNFGTFVHQNDLGRQLHRTDILVQKNLFHVIRYRQWKVVPKHGRHDDSFFCRKWCIQPSMVSAE